MYQISKYMYVFIYNALSLQFIEKLKMSFNCLNLKLCAPTLRSGEGMMENGGSNVVMLTLLLKN